MGEAAVGRAQLERSRSAVRVLQRADLADAVRLLSINPVENVFVAARVRASGVEQASLGCPIWGFERGGTLRSICHAGSNLVPVNADSEAVHAYADYAGAHRTCSSLLGPSTTTLEFWRLLSERWGASWSDIREVRPCQPVMAIDSDSEIPVDLRVRRVTLQHWDAYYQAAIKMYTEEVGVSPLQGNSAGYRFYVRQLITSGRAFGMFSGDRVIFKADLGSVSANVSQVQGVWLDPEFRGCGLAAPAMSAVVHLARSVTPTVSLYVNDYNLPALATYRRVGFSRVGEFATVLY